MKKFNYKKAVQALNLFATLEGGVINYMKAVKLVWLSDRVHVRNYGRTITSDFYIAMKNGTVPSGTKDIVLKSGFLEDDVISYSNLFLSEPENYTFKSTDAVDEKVFSKTDLRILHEVYETYKHHSQFDLSDYSHKFIEWQRFEKEIESGVKKSFPINEDDFFNIPNEDKLFSQDKELLELSRKHFRETA